jgi:hypothetical protein
VNLWTRLWPGLLAVTVVSAVGTPAAVASYRHARDVVISTGDTVMAPWLPLSVDGMLLAALVVIWVRRHRGEDAGKGPWAAFLFGMVVTVAANLAAVGLKPAHLGVPDGTDYVVALFPPVALAVTLELVALVAYRTRTAVEDVVTDKSELPAVEPVIEDVPVLDEPVSDNLDTNGLSKLWETAPLTLVPEVPPAAKARETKPQRPAKGLAELAAKYSVDLDHVVKLLADGAGRGALATELNVTPHAARQLAAAYNKEQAA